MFFYDPTYFLVIIGLLLAAFASYGVQAAFKKYSNVKSYRHYTGFDAARKILDDNDIKCNFFDDSNSALFEKDLWKFLEKVLTF